MQVLSCCFATVLVLGTVLGPAAAQIDTESVVANTMPSAALARSAIDSLKLIDVAEGWRELLRSQTPTLPDECAKNDELEARLSAAWKDAVDSTFSSKAVAVEIEAKLQRDATTEQFKAAVAFHGTDLGRKVHAAEHPPKMSKAPEALKKELAELGRYQLLIDANPQRKKLLAKLALESNAVEIFVDTMTATAESATLGVMHAMPDVAPGLDALELQSFIEKLRPQLRKMAVAMLPPGMAKIYSRLSDADLEAYLEEIGKPAARSFAGIFSEAFKAAMRKQAAAVGVAFAKNIRTSRI